MIKTLYQVGKAVKDLYPDYFEAWEQPFNLRSLDKAKVILFHIVDGVLNDQPEEEVYKPALSGKYLYRTLKGPNGTNLVPTFYLYLDKNSEKQAENTRKLMVRIKASVKNSKLPFLNSTSELQKLEAAIMKLGEISSPENKYLITFKLNGKWFGEYEVYRNLFEEEAFAKYYDKSLGKDQVCAITHQPTSEVWGRVDTLGFTVNDAPFSRSGFNPKLSYKMFPVSPDAVKILEGSRRLVLDKMTFSFYNLRYFILPHFITGTEDQIEDAVKNFIRIASKKPESLDDQSKSIFNYDSLLFDIIDEANLSKSSVYYDIFFYQQNQAQFQIRLQLNDVLPSQIGKIFSIKQRLEKRYQPLFSSKGNQKNYQYFVTLAKVKDYFSHIVKKEVVFEPYFFKILEALFYGTKLNQQLILEAFLRKIKEGFRQKNDDEKKYDFANKTKESWILFHFFHALDLFSNQNTKTLSMENTPISLKTDLFVEQHPDFFNHESKKGAFYLGCLTEMLLYKQRSKLKSEPFIKVLNGLNLDLHALREVFFKLKDKLNQYSEEFEYKSEKDMIHHYQSIIAPALMTVGEDVSKTDLSFAFSSGLVMQREYTEEQIQKNIEAKKLRTADSSQENN
jgi:CRISPR-associated Csh1 family protein